MYCVEKRVSFSDVGPDFKIKLTKLLDYFQDTCIGESEGGQYGTKGLREKGYVWVLSSWQVVINRYPELGEEVVVGTAPYEFKGFMGLRNFILKDAQGEVLACANSIWSFVDTEKFALTRIPKEIETSYHLEEKLDMNYAPRKIVMPEDMEKSEDIEVLYHNLDPNNHVNNAQYVAIAEDLIPEGRRCRQLRAEYRASAHADNVITPYLKKDIENRIYIVSLADEEGKPYVVVEFSE